LSSEGLSGEEEVNEWEERLLDLLKQVQMNGEKDSVIWKPEKSEQYTTRSMMKTFRGIVSKRKEKKTPEK